MGQPDHFCGHVVYVIDQVLGRCGLSPGVESEDQTVYLLIVKESENDRWDRAFGGLNDVLRAADLPLVEIRGAEDKPFDGEPARTITLGIVPQG